MITPKPNAAFDLDGTLFKTSMLEVVYAEAYESELIGPEYAEKVRATEDNWKFNLNTEDTYTSSVYLMIQALMRAMQGRHRNELTDLAQQAARSTQLRKRRFVHEAMQLLRPTHEITIISASHRDITLAFLETYEIDIPSQNVYGSAWDLDNDHFTGTGRTIVKKDALEQVARDGRGQLNSKSVSIGDTVSDLDMLLATRIGFMVNPSRTLEIRAGGRLHRIRESKDNIDHITPYTGTPIEPPFLLQEPAEILERVGLLIA